jgi:magnesium-transporting ATPase (P-type)
VVSPEIICSVYERFSVPKKRMKSSLYGRLLPSNAVMARVRMQRWTAQTVREIANLKLKILLRAHAGDVAARSREARKGAPEVILEHCDTADELAAMREEIARKINQAYL